MHPWSRVPRPLPGLRPGSLLLALIVLGAPGVAQASSYLLERDGRAEEVSSRLLARREVVDLADAAAFFGMQLRRERKRLELEGERGVIRLQIGRAAIQVHDQPVLMTSEVNVEDGRVYVPLDFLTRAMPRYLDEDVRHDARARSIRYDPKGAALTCERFDDRLRITLGVGRAIASPDVQSEGDRRVIVLRGISLPASTGGCPFDDTLRDLQVQPGEGGTLVTLFTGPNFGGLELKEIPSQASLVIDVLDASAAPPPVAAQPEQPEGMPPALPPRDEIFDTVVIDPGHGGEDRGARGAGGLEEKDACLATSLKLAKALRDAGLRVVLTRSSDVAVPLAARTELANRERADLFVSIHANASPSEQAWGAETYFLHLDATDEAARSLAARENDATGLRARGGVRGDLEMLLWDMAQQQYLEESSRLADTVQRELNALLGTRDRGVKQANFMVLRGATMPAILVEIGFVSNREEEAKLRSDDFQARIADAITRAILAFRDARQAAGGPR